MECRQPALVAILASGLVLSGCSSSPRKYLADDARRQEVIEALVSDHVMREEVIDRLVGPPNDRAAVIDRILKDDDATGHLIQRILRDDRGKALVAGQVAADSGAKTFIRMLMLTGVMGDSITQKQAQALGLGAAFAYGNQRRTMGDLKRVGERIEAWAKRRGGRYPVCPDFGALNGCLSNKLEDGKLEGIRITDAWGNPFQYHSNREGTEYILVSYATDGEYDGLGKVGPTESFDCDIVFSNGDFIQWPGYLRKSEIR
ncbi:MAG: hypothetical protein ACE5JH_01240 [Acidobacteriota bacterium]